MVVPVAGYVVPNSTGISMDWIPWGKRKKRCNEESTQPLQQRKDNRRQGARMCNLTMREFLNLASRKGIHLQYGKEELEEDLV